MRPQPVTRPLSELAALLCLATLDDSVSISGVSHDSRRIQPGDLYAALPGLNTHGARFISQAVAAGATAVFTDVEGEGLAIESNVSVPLMVVADPREQLGRVSSWVYGNPSHQLTMIGVTGTDGKTTTATLCETAFNDCGIRTGLIGTVVNRFGDRVFDGGRTTPEAPDLHAMLAVMLEQGAQAVVMEVSSHAIALSRVSGIQFDLAVFTNLSHDHLDFHGDIESYFATKQRLFTAEYSAAGLVCVDDSWGRLLVDQASIPVSSYGVSGGDDARADWLAFDLVPTAERTTFSVRGPSVEVTAACRLPGDFNVRNALAAAVSAIELGVSAERAFGAVAQSPGVPGRMERVALPSDAGPSVFVDYAHTPDAVQRALLVSRSLAEKQAGRVLLALGCGGDRDIEKRFDMGRVGAELADVFVITDDNPRSEDPAVIRQSIRMGADAASSGAEILEIGDRGDALRWLVAHAGKNDVVVALGKGHETTQEVAGELIPFDDRVELRAAMTAATK